MAFFNLCFMKVYRGPKGKYGGLTETDEVRLKDKYLLIEPESIVYADLTIEKSGDRHSLLGLSFSEEDLDHLHDNYLILLKKELKKSRKKNELITMFIFNILKYLELNKSDKLLIDDSINYVKNIVYHLSSQQISFEELEKLSKKEVVPNFLGLLSEKKKRSPKSAIQRLRYLLKNYPSEFNIYIGKLLKTENSEKKIHNLELILNDVNLERSILKKIKGNLNLKLSNIDLLKLLVKRGL